MVTGPEEGAAAVGGRGRLRASRTDRERVIELLKAAFVEERLDKDEFDARVGQAFASRTYAELAAVIADLPVAAAAAVESAPGGLPAVESAPGGLPAIESAPGGLPAIESAAAAPAAAGQTSTPARTLAKAALRACLCVLVAAALVGVSFLTRDAVLGFFAAFAVPAAAIAASGFLGYGVIDAWQERRPRAQLRPGSGQPGGRLGNERYSQVGHGQPSPSTSPDPTRPDRTRPDRTRPDRTRADLPIRSSQPGWTRPFWRAARTPRGIRPAPGAA